jgi:hypothetical protein
MADDNDQRLTRNPYARTASKAASGNDPLAELARLIGQTDPFAEFGHKQQPTATQTQQWAPQAGYPDHAQEQYAPASADHDATTQQAGYRHDQYAAAEYDSGGYYQDDVPGAQAPHDYDDVQPPRRRTAMLAIAAIVMLAVVGTAGAYGYRALFGSAGSSPPPVIKADTTPTKVVPSAKAEASSNKLIYDRVGDRNTASQEKIVSREEKPVDIKDTKPAQVGLFPSAVGNANASVTPVSASPLDQPKKVHTIAIRPDQSADAPTTASTGARAQQAPPVAQASAPTPPPAPAKPATAPQRLASSPPTTTADAEDTPSRVAPTRAAAAPRPANAPLSLSPDAARPPAAAPAPAPQPARTASVPRATAGAAPAGQYAVQVSSQRSEAEAQAAFRSLQGKYPSQLGGREPIIRRADLGSKGIYYRAMVGPFANGSEASQLCQSLKSAGGSCLIQKN